MEPSSWWPGWSCGGWWTERMTRWRRRSRSRSSGRRKRRGNKEPSTQNNKWLWHSHYSKLVSYIFWLNFYNQELEALLTSLVLFNYIYCWNRIVIFILGNHIWTTCLTSLRSQVCSPDLSYQQLPWSPHKGCHCHPTMPAMQKIQFSRATAWRDMAP